MSQIGKKIIEIPENITVNVSNNIFTAKGPLGELSHSINNGIEVLINENTIEVKRNNDDKQNKELHGLTRSLVYNILIGVNEGYKKELNLVGVGYTADAKGDYLLLNLGYSHPIYFQRPDAIQFETPSATSIVIKGIDKQAVGQVAAKIRSLRKPEPYKGKGVRYSDEFVRRKAGKKVAGAA